MSCRCISRLTGQVLVSTRNGQGATVKTKMKVDVEDDLEGIQ
jgi:hypothetical protein